MPRERVSWILSNQLAPKFTGKFNQSQRYHHHQRSPKEKHHFLSSKCHPELFLKAYRHVRYHLRPYIGMSPNPSGASHHIPKPHQLIITKSPNLGLMVGKYDPRWLEPRAPLTRNLKNISPQLFLRGVGRGTG
jgi:hypothetical protein